MRFSICCLPFYTAFKSVLHLLLSPPEHLDSSPMQPQLAFSDRHAYINGKARQTGDPVSFEALDPSTLEVLSNIYTIPERTLDEAIRAATEAFRTWSCTTPIDQSRILSKAAGIVRTRAHYLAVIETQSTGKPYWETSQVDIPAGADVLEYYADLIASDGLNGEAFRVRPSTWVYTPEAPLGVCVGIGAWNYPLQIALRKLTRFGQEWLLGESNNIHRLYRRYEYSH